MADQGRSDFYVVFTMSLCALTSRHILRHVTSYVIMTSSLLCWVSKIAENSLYLNRCCFFIFYPILFKLDRNIQHKYCLKQRSWIQKNRRVPCSDDLIYIIIAFLTNMVPFFSYLSKILLLDTDYEKVCYSWNIYRKENNLWHWINKYVDLS